MWRDPYVAGVERFELPAPAGASPLNTLQRTEQAVLFCLLLWKYFQAELRMLRYHLNFECRADMTVEFYHMPHYEELINLDSSGASQIDMEFISQQPARIARHPALSWHGEDEYFPAFLEVFIPLWPEVSLQPTSTTGHTPQSQLIVWCKPALLSKVIELWEQASIIASGQG